MRSALLLISTLALALTGVAPSHAAEFIAQVAASARDAGAAASAEPLANRLAATGASLTRRLSDGLPALGALRTSALRANPGTARLDVFGFDPERVWLIAAEDSSATAALLAGSPDVEWFEANALREQCALPPGFPNDPLWIDTRQWALHNVGPSGAYSGTAGADIHALEAWELSTGSNDMLLAIADTGIDPAHPELAGTLPDGRTRLVYGFNVTTDPPTAFADSFSHGTSVAGVMVARTHNGVLFDSMGVAGVCGGDGAGNAGCRLVPIKITRGRSGVSSSFDIARAILHATSVGARAMNLSFAGDGPSLAERATLYWAITHGCVVVAAAGNRGTVDPTAAQYPAAYASEGLCIQVGASDANDQRAAFSSYGRGLDLLAPGLNIWTTFMTYRSSGGVLRNGFAAASGTSFAAPHVTGAIGLLAALRPDLADTDFQHVLRESADDIGTPGVDTPTAHGRLNAAAALRAVADSDLVVIHDEIGAQGIRLLDSDSLVIGDSGPGAMDRPRVWPVAERWEITATVPIPPGYSAPPRVWSRVGGTMTVRGDYRLPYFVPWCELAAVNASDFTLRGYVYRVPPPCAGCDELWIPVPPDQARFGYSILGRVPAATPPAAVAIRGAALRVTPNPVRGEARFTSNNGGTIEVIDITGRRMRRMDAAEGRWTWDGRDEHGVPAPAGLYFARRLGGRSAAVRFVKLGGG